MKTYDTGVMKLKCETEEDLKILRNMYPNEDDPEDGWPCPPPPKGE